MTSRSYKIDELARAAGMSVRTVRYYVQRGLLEAPAFRGKDTAYGHEHLVRLRAVRRLQEAYFPLDAIGAELDGRTLAELERIADGKELPALPGPAPRATAAMPTRARARTLASRGSRLLRRIELLPGVELTVDDEAAPESLELVEKILTLLEANVTGGGRTP